MKTYGREIDLLNYDLFFSLLFITIRACDKKINRLMLNCDFNLNLNILDIVCELMYVFGYMCVYDVRGNRD